MRPSVAALLALPLFATIAEAGPRGGGGGSGGKRGGGALSAVSSGIRGAQAASPSPSNGGLNTSGYREHDQSDYYYCRDFLYREIECRHRITMTNQSAFGLHRPLSYNAYRGPGATIDFYAGAQKVHDSDGAGTIELSITEERFRLGASFSRYFERIQGGGALHMSTPTLLAGIRLDDLGPTAAFLEAGVVHVRTSGDPMGDSQMTGPIAGFRVEHALSAELGFLGDLYQMWFDDDIRATAARVAVRYKYLQAGFRVLDFNVGPALYGPEVGVRF